MYSINLTVQVVFFFKEKSCFLVDLRSFLLAFFVWTENKGAFTVA